MTTFLLRSATTLVVVVGSVLLVAFLGGLASAALEIRKEKRAGLVPTRPGWEARRKSKARGLRGAMQANVGRIKHFGMGVRTCWCGYGPLQVFPSDADPDGPGEVGCAAWEAGHLGAFSRHDDAGGYQRVPAW